ncbi:MAG: uroporphyrinogen-III synthase [Pseudomonadota bacterium]
MKRALIIVRPEPGNSATSASARARGLEVHSFPLFETASTAWDAPEPARYVGVMMTSANAARLAGPDLQRYTHLPLYAVGDVTGDAARESGFLSIISGDGDVERLLGKIATLGLHRLLHLSGADFQPFTPHGVEVERQIVYASHAIGPAPELLAALKRGGVVMLHSARAAKQFATIVEAHGFDRSSLSLAAISANAADAAGAGWGEVSIAAQPRDAALLDSAVALCENC